MYLEKASRYDDPFEYDMSGMTLNAIGEDLDSLTVIDLKEGSPAADAGFQKGDLILKINHRTLHNSRLSEINSLLRRREGMKVRCLIDRNGVRLKKSFILRRMI